MLHSVYRATDVMFRGETQLEQTRSYTKNLLHKSIASSATSIFHKIQVEHDLSHPWTARLDHLDHRMWIEQNLTTTPPSPWPPLWIMGNKEYMKIDYKLGCIPNEKSKLMRLAINNFESIYAQEMKQVTRWLEESGLKGIGFKREKSSYCYFASAASTCFPHDSISRLIMAKSAILITIADDFHGSITEIHSFTLAIQRWDGMNLSGHGKTIFAALDDFIRVTVAKCCHQQSHQLTTMFKDIWKETFDVWMVERSWSNSGHIPTMDEYLKTAMVSVAIHTIVLMTYPCLNPNIPIENLKATKYHNITQLLMLVARLLNDMQSYQREVEEEGKINYIMVYKRQNPEAGIEDSVEYMKNMLEEKTKEFLECVVLMNDDDDDEDDMVMPRSLRELEMSCMKVYYMFYNSTNAFDSDTGPVKDMINKAFYLPLQYSHA